VSLDWRQAAEFGPGAAPKHFTCPALAGLQLSVKRRTSAILRSAIRWLFGFSTSPRSDESWVRFRIGCGERTGLAPCASTVPGQFVKVKARNPIQSARLHKGYFLNLACIPTCGS